MQRFIETVLFLAFYCPIRQFSGGFHAENYKRCLLVFLFMYFSNVIVVNKLIIIHQSQILILIAVLSYIFIVIISPFEHRYNTLTNYERKKYRKIVMFICTLLIIISTVGLRFSNLFRYSMFGLSVLICIFLMLIAGKIRDEQNDILTNSEK